jgi:cysteine desulfurase/selenocysteine lyase
VGCDFLALSGHKVIGPSGIGVLWGRREWLARVAPSLLGGGMVHHSSLSAYQLKEPPWCFEAGTPNIEGAVGLAAALNFLTKIGMDRVQEHSLALGRQLHEGLRPFADLRPLSSSDQEHYGIVSFVVTIPGLSSETFGRLLADSYGILVSAGRHCAHPYHDCLGIASTVRASTHVYSTEEEVTRFLDAVRELVGPSSASGKEICNEALAPVS